MNIVIPLWWCWVLPKGMSGSSVLWFPHWIRLCCRMCSAPQCVHSPPACACQLHPSLPELHLQLGLAGKWCSRSLLQGHLQKWGAGLYPLPDFISSLTELLFLNWNCWVRGVFLPMDGTNPVLAVSWFVFRLSTQEQRTPWITVVHHLPLSNSLNKHGGGVWTKQNQKKQHREYKSFPLHHSRKFGKH